MVLREGDGDGCCPATGSCQVGGDMCELLLYLRFEVWFGFGFGFEDVIVFVLLLRWFDFRLS